MIVFPLLLVQFNDRFGLWKLWCSSCQTLAQLLVLAGMVVITDSIRSYKKIPLPIDPQKHLETNGLFQFTRNPMYLGIFAILLAEVIYLGHLLLFFYFLLFVFSFHFYVVKKEEPMLEKRFREEYLEYKKKTPRWLLKKSIPEILSSLQKTVRQRR